MTERLNDQEAVAGLEKEIHELTKALTGLTCGGSEFFSRKGERYVADIKACVDYVRRRDTDAHNRTVRAIRDRQKAEARIAELEAAHPTPVGDRWNDALEAIAQGMAVSRDQDEAEAYSHCGTSDWDGSPSDYIADCRAEIRTILDAALAQPTSLRSVEEDQGAAYTPTAAEIREGESLDTISFIVRPGETQETAFQRAACAEVALLRLKVRELSAHPLSVDSEARIAELEAALKRIADNDFHNERSVHRYSAARELARTALGLRSLSGEG